MIGIGTIINVAGIVVGGLLGHYFGKNLKDRYLETLSSSCGLSVLFIGISGAMTGMLKINNGGLEGRQTMLLVICLALGGLIGEILNIENHLINFGKWIKDKSGNSKDNRFIDAFVTATLTVCIGAMAIVGAIQDGIFGDWSILGTKSILDLVIIMVMTSSLGKGCIFSALPVFIFQGTITLLATFLKPFMTDLALANISLVGSVLIFCIGLNILRDKKIRVANLLPAIVLAVIASFL